MDLKINEGLLAPVLKNQELAEKDQLANDQISIYRNVSTIN